MDERNAKRDLDLDAAADRLRCVLSELEGEVTRAVDAVVFVGTPLDHQSRAPARRVS